MYSLKIKVVVHPYKKLEFENALTQFINQISVNKNIIHHGITKDLNNIDVYYYEEDWKSKENMDKHFSSENFQTIIGAMKVLGEITNATLIYADKEENFIQRIN